MLALTAIFATFGLIAIPSSLVPIDETVYELILLIGLAVGVDYSMFYLKREREERAAGRSEAAALEAAASTSGRSVLISGLTVIIAMAGMFFAGIQGMTQFGLGTIMVVAVAMVGSLTVLPAVLAWLGDRVDKGRVPFVGRASPRRKRRPGLGRDHRPGAPPPVGLDRPVRRPARRARVAGAPAPHRECEPGDFPADLPVIKTYKQLQASFPGTDPANVVVKAEDVRSPEAQSGDRRPQAARAGQRRVERPHHRRRQQGGDCRQHHRPDRRLGLRQRVERVARGAPRRHRACHGRHDSGAEVGVSGFTAESKDFSDKIKAVAPLVFGFVLVFAFGLLLFAFRSLVIAVKAIVLNLLSVAAAYGILVLVFQHGVGKGLLGFESTAGIDSFLPIFIFVILFGLSMDYHVFILSRIREAYDRGDEHRGGGHPRHQVDRRRRHERGDRHGLRVLGIRDAPDADLQTVRRGPGSGDPDRRHCRPGGAAARIDEVLGDWNWYLPSWLEWLPHLEHGGSIEPVQPPPPVKASPALGPTGR